MKDLKCRLPDDLWDKINVKSKAEQCSISQYVRLILQKSVGDPEFIMPVRPYRSNCGKDFDEFWQAYPRRNGVRAGKVATLALFRKIPKSDWTKVIAAATNYSASKQATEGFVRDPERFLKKDYWRDWAEKPEVESKYAEVDEIETPKILWACKDEDITPL